MAQITSLFTSAWALVREHKRAFVLLNLAYYGLIVVFMGVAALRPALQDELLRATDKELTNGPLAVVSDAYTNAKVFKAIALTFVVNLLIGSAAWITLPSMLIPFLGILLGMYRAIMWGLLFYPGHPDLQITMIPHSLTLIVEGQAYVLAMLAAWVQGRAFLFPKSVGIEGHWQGYIEGLKRTGRIYFVVGIVLLIAAVYEVFEVILVAKLKGT